MTTILGNIGGNNNQTSVAANIFGNNDDSNESAANNNNANEVADDVLGNIANNLGNTVNGLNNFANDIIDNVINNRGYDENDSTDNLKKKTTNNENNAPSEEIERNFKQKDNSKVTKSVPTNVIQNIDANEIDINSITNSIDGITGLLVSRLLGSITDLTGCSNVDGEGQESALMREKKFLALYMQLSEVRKL